MIEFKRIETKKKFDFERLKIGTVFHYNGVEQLFVKITPVYCAQLGYSQNAMELGTGRLAAMIPRDNDRCQEVTIIHYATE